MEINGSTEIYGIIGNPVAHSLSPAMHNSAFQALGLNKAYIPFHATDAEKALEACLTLNVKGLSVTIPHKEAVLPFINSIDPVAEKLLDYLKSNNGEMDITDKSPAELIYVKFGVSKRAFKQAVGQLYKKRLISIKQYSISLLLNDR